MIRPSSSAAPRRRGTSLLGVLVLLAVLGVAASLAIPAWFHRPDVTLENAAHLLAQDLRDVQNRATLAHFAMEVRFEPDGDGYRAVRTNGEPLNAPVGDGPFVRTYSRDAVFRGVRVLRVDFEGAEAMRFDRRGSAVTTGEIVLGFRGEERTVHVDRRTGRLYVDAEPVRFGYDE